MAGSVNPPRHPNRKVSEMHVTDHPRKHAPAASADIVGPFSRWPRRAGRPRRRMAAAGVAAAAAAVFVHCIAPLL